jgi:gluconate 2-dehydrogenase gamma chain
VNNGQFSRRHFLTRSAALGAAAATITPLGSADGRTIQGEIPWAPGEADSPTPVSKTESYLYFTLEETAFIGAAVARLIPEDELGPGAREVGCPLFIDRQLAGAYGRAERWYMRGPWAQGSKTQGYQSRMTPAQVYRAAITSIDAHCRSTFDKKAFAELGPDDQDKVLSELEDGKIKLDAVDASAFFKQLLLNTQEGFFADPLYGGNKDMAAWKMIGFPGARYDYRDYVGKHGEKFPLPPVSLKGRPAWNTKS